MRVRAVAGEVTVPGMSPPRGSERRRLVASEVASHRSIRFGRTRLVQEKRFVKIKSSLYFREPRAWTRSTSPWTLSVGFSLIK
jgi:hypothetical protein